MLNVDELTFAKKQVRLNGKEFALSEKFGGLKVENL